MITQSFEQLVASLAKKSPTPGGGAAAAMAGCMGTALFLMVVRFSRGKKANVDREQDLADVEQLLDDHLQRMLPMAERDCRSFDLVSAAYGMPKETDAEKALREKGIQEALVGAMVVPEEAQAMVRDVFVSMEKVTDCIGKAIVSDLASGAALLLAAAEGAYLNVRINAAYLTNRELAESTMQRADNVRDEIRRHQHTIAVSVEDARMSKRPPPLLLCVLDGFGEAPSGPGNAITVAEPRYWQELRQRYPTSLLSASGEDVGLPCGLMGNSEVGHLNIGAGRVVYQEISRIDREIREGRFKRNEALQSAFAHVSGSGATLHLFGLVSDGGVHSSEQHLRALLEMARAAGLTGDRVVLHAFLDGRDTPPRSAQKYIEQVEGWCRDLGVGRIASVVGRYWAMDRDKRWERVQRAYDLLVLGTGLTADSAQAAIAAAYERGEGDEFVQPTVIGSPDRGRVRTGDAVIFFNYRTDRARQLTEAFVSREFDSFPRASVPVVHFVTMTRYRDDFPCPVAFPPQHLRGILPQIVSEAGLKQLRIAETEKYAHVTFFFSGGDESEYLGERRVLVPSPKVATYDLQPEMSAVGVTDALLQELEGDDRPDVTILNFANADMVGHTGVVPAAIEAVRAIDRCLARIVPAYLKLGGTAAITADHGNVEQMIDPVTGGIHTAHTTNPVPFVVCSDALVNRRLRASGRLCDIATTLLPILGLDRAPDMEGVDLFS